MTEPRKFRAFVLPGQITSDPDKILADRINRRRRVGELSGEAEAELYHLDMGGWEISGKSEKCNLLVFDKDNQPFGIITELTNFRNLPDFAYIPTESEAPMHIYPFCISNQTSPFNFRFDKKTSNTEKQQQPVSVPVMHFADSVVPAEPTAELDLEISTVVNTVRILFERRPVWMRVAIEEAIAEFEIEPENEPRRTGRPRTSPMSKGWRLVTALKQVAYLFNDGPWRNTYVRYGYDPRVDANSRNFQVIDFRDPFLRGSTAPPANSRGGSIDCHFRVPPVNRSQLYQLCDIEDAGIQSLLSSTSPTEACSYSNGWLEPEISESIRNQLKVKSEAMRRTAKTI